MTMFEFGRRPPEGVAVAAAWGARAIYRRGLVDIVPDRQQLDRPRAETPDKFIAWLDKKLIPWANKLSGDMTEVFTLEDGLFRAEASEQSSYGYLYIGAWMLTELPAAAEAKPLFAGKVFVLQPALGLYSCFLTAGIADAKYWIHSTHAGQRSFTKGELKGIGATAKVSRGVYAIPPAS